MLRSKSRIPGLLGIEYPIFQGGMAWVSDASIAAAVSEAGGFGIIAAANAPADIIKEEIREAKRLTSKPFGVNIMMLSPYVEEIAQLVIEEKVAGVTTGAGNPYRYMKVWKEAGIKVIPVIPSVAYARRMQKLGADAVIAEGLESGGHIGKITTMALVPQVADAMDIPVIAAGGIADGRGMAAAFMLGAEGIQMGTRFISADECTVHENYKKKIFKADDRATTVTGRATGHPVRCLKNNLSKSFHELEWKNSTLEEYEALGAQSLRRAAREGDIKNGTVMAGQIAGLVSGPMSAEEIINNVSSDAESLLGEKLW